MGEIKVESIREEVSIDASGRPRPSIVVRFRVGDDGPFSLMADREAFDPDKMRGELADYARKISRVRSE